MIQVAVLFALSVALLALAVFDVMSTRAFLAKGTGYEANRFMAWLQTRFPSSWAAIRVGGSLALNGAALALPWPLSPVALFAMVAMCAVTVKENIAISESPT